MELSKQETSPDKPDLKKAKFILSAEKVMSVVFCDSLSVILALTWRKTNLGLLCQINVAIRYRLGDENRDIPA